MPRETTPPKITREIKRLCRKIAPKSKLLVVPVKAAPDALLNECFPNVKSMIEHHGGEMVSGWTIWQWANILIEAEAHAIWKNPNGELIDITPHDDGETNIFFLPDDNVTYEGMRIPAHRMALTNSSLVKEFIHLMEKQDAISCSTKGKYVSIPFELDMRLRDLKIRFNTEVTRNKLCPCGSGLRYKNCCGAYI